MKHGRSVNFFDVQRKIAEVYHEFDLISDFNNGSVRVDVVSLIGRAGIPMLYRPLDKLLGAYVSSPVKGILINSKRRKSIQNFTAAHELGHSMLGHSDSQDLESTIFGLSNISAMEMEANYFASNFLLPKRVLINAAKEVGIKKASEIVDPIQIYRMSLLTGTSYEATLIGLKSANLLASDLPKKMTPKEIKQRILNGYSLENSWSDVHYLDERTLSTREDCQEKSISISDDDCVLVELEQMHSSGYLWSVSDDSDSRVICSTKVDSCNSFIGTPSVACFHLFGFERDTQIKFSLNRPWISSPDMAIRKITINVRVNKPEIGIPKRHRESFGYDHR